MNLYTTGYTGANNDISTALQAAVGKNSTTTSNSST